MKSSDQPTCLTDEQLKILKEMGFEQTEDCQPHIFTHRIVNLHFDFSACSFTGVIYKVFAGGYNEGVKDVEAKFNKLFDKRI